jgi:hypothetical protein
MEYVAYRDDERIRDLTIAPTCALGAPKEFAI